jgi:predicted transcriptional regulator
MDVQDLVPQIEGLGLSNKEARVYLACLGLEMASVQGIADEAAVKRVTTYVILEGLMALGLVSQNIKGKKTYFVPEDPSRLETLLRRRSDELSEQNKSLKEMLPKLEALRNTQRDLPEVKYYSGVESVRGLLTEFLAASRGSANEILSINNSDELTKFLPEHETGPKQANHPLWGSKNRVVYTSEHGPRPSLRTQDQMRGARYVPFAHYPLSGNVAIAGDTLVMTTMVGKTPIGVKIRNAEMGKAMAAIFEMTWEYSGTFNKPT